MDEDAAGVDNGALWAYLTGRTRDPDAVPPSLSDGAFSDSTDVVLVFRPDMVLEWASPSLLDVYGWDPAAVVGTRFNMLESFEGNTLASCMRAIEERAEQFESTGRVRCADGTSRWTFNRLRTAWTSTGERGYTAVTVRDIDDAVRAQHELRRLRDEVELMWATTTEVIYRSSLEGVIEWVSPTVHGLLGWRPEEVVGEALVGLVHPDDRPLMRSRQHLLAIGRTVNCRTRLRTADHDYCSVELVVHPIRADDGSVTGRVGRWRRLETAY